MQNDWIQGTVTVGDGIELFYTRIGKGDKPYLVLAHGLSDSGLCWHQLARDLAADYDILMYDAYGHGKSSRVDPDKRFDLAADLYDLMEAMQIEKPGLIGHSMGAATVADFAARYPDKLSTLVLEDPPWIDISLEVQDIKETLHNWKLQNLAAKKKTVKELQKLKHKESPNWEEAILPEWAQAKHDIDPAFFELLAIRNGNWQSLAEKITVPTLIITGDNELGAIVTPKLGVEAVQMLNQGEFGHISGAGHCVRYEQYLPYITMVKVFLKRNM